MTDAFKRVNSGDPIRLSARMHNETINTILAVKRTGLTSMDDKGLRAGRNRREVLVRNQNGVEIKKYNLVLLKSVENAPENADGSVASIGTLPVDLFFDDPYTWSTEPIASAGNKYYHEGSWGIALDDIPNGQSGRVCIEGIVPGIIQQNADGDAALDYVDVPYNHGSFATPNCGGGTVLFPERHGSGRGRVLYSHADPIPGTTNLHYAVIHLGEMRQMSFMARIVGINPTPIGVYDSDGNKLKNWRWKYTWERYVHRPPSSSGGGSGGSGGSGGGGDTSATDHQWRPVSEVNLSGIELEHSVSNEGTTGGGDVHYAFNRYESHLADSFTQVAGGTEGYMKHEACNITGAPEACPPSWAMVPDIVPTPTGTIVNMTATKNALGQTLWSFEAMTPIEFLKANVPQPSAEDGDDY